MFAGELEAKVERELVHEPLGAPVGVLERPGHLILDPISRSFGVG